METGSVVDLVYGAEVEEERIPSGAAVGGWAIAALVDRSIHIVRPDKVTGHVLVDTGHPLAGLVGGVLRLPQDAAAHVGGAVPDELCEVGNALANPQVEDSS